MTKAGKSLAYLTMLVVGVHLSMELGAQNFTFDPGDEYTATLPMDSYTDHFVYVNHDALDSALISWRVVGNTCPDDWHISLCDWADCYSYLPNTGDMLPVAPGQSGFIKLTMNPYLIPGEGTVHFWIYPTGHQEEHIDLFFHFNTEMVTVQEIEMATAAYPNPFSSELAINVNAGDHVRITDMLGRVYFQNSGTPSIPVKLNTDAWPSGCYVLTTGNRTMILLKP